MNQLAHRISNQRTRVLTAGLVVLLALTGPAFASEQLTPTESVKSTIAEVIHVLNNAELKQPGRAVERRQEIEQIVRHRVSYEDMAKHALGMPWLDLTDAGRQEFVDLFVQLLRDTFAGKIDAYADEQIHYLLEQRGTHLAEVKTELSGSKTNTLLDFQLVDRSGEWLVYDVVIDGASIVSNYRAQFTSIVRTQSYEGLLKKMKEHTLVVKAFETTTAP